MSFEWLHHPDAQEEVVPIFLSPGIVENDLLKNNPLFHVEQIEVIDIALRLNFCLVIAFVVLP